MTQNETFEQKEFDGVVVRRSNEHPKFWVAYDGRVVGPSDKWLAPSAAGSGGHVKVAYRRKPVQVNVYIHRLVCETWLENFASLPQVDHIDNNPKNNHASNLRPVTNRTNHHNLKRTKQGNTASKYYGVILRKRDMMWSASIQIAGRQKHLGSFTNEANAARAYDAALLALGLQPVNFPV